VSRSTDTVNRVARYHVKRGFRRPRVGTTSGVSSYKTIGDLLTMAGRHKTAKFTARREISASQVSLGLGLTRSATLSHRMKRATHSDAA
jgi:hypothetical protein